LLLAEKNSTVIKECNKVIALISKTIWRGLPLSVDLNILQNTEKQYENE
jgi:hypothetical protein